MAVVLNSEENSYFISSPLRRSHSQPMFLSTQSYANSSFRPKKNNSFRTLINLPALASSDAASPRSVLSSSIPCSPSSSEEVSPTSGYETIEDETDQIVFPFYNDVSYYDQPEEIDLQSNPCIEDAYTVLSPEFPTEPPAADINSTDSLSRPLSSNLVEHAEDDMSIRVQPSRHVDYLSHNWREEDIWSSWKYVVSKRKSYNNSARLENASWRTWIKAKNKLKTVSPETLNWLKDCDVTWLYGPLQYGSEPVYKAPTASPSGVCRSKTNSFLIKKPILKKRSMSEIMLQKSLSSSSLLKQAAAAVQAQQSSKFGVDCTRTVGSTSKYLFAYPTPRSSGLHPSCISSVSSTNLPSPVNGEKKRIHFNEQVEQCIALEIKGEDDDEPYPSPNYIDSDSDDGGIMMKRSTTKRKLPPLMSKKKTRPSPSIESKTIAKLPSTTLKYKQNTPETPRIPKKYSSEIWNGTLLSPSPSLETLRPSKSSSKIFLGDDDDDDMDWYPPSNFPSRRDSVVVAQERLIGSDSSDNLSNLPEAEPSGIHKSPSGIFMPCEEDEDGSTSEGIFGKVVETVNTAKDIAHVIWNVGWMR